MKLVDCRRCGQQNLAWVQSKRTGRYYLAKTQSYHGASLGGDRGYSRGGVSVLVLPGSDLRPGRRAGSLAVAVQLSGGAL